MGMFVLLFGVGTIAALLWLIGFGRGPTKTYVVYMKESVSGLAKDSSVKYRGVEVGHVDRISVLPQDPETIVLLLDIEPTTPVREDTRAQLEFQGLTGLAFINLIGGSRESPPLRKKSGQKHPVIESAPSLMSKLEANVLDTLESLKQASEDLSHILGTMDQKTFANTIENLERVTGALAKHSGELERGTADASRFFANAADASEDLPALVAQVESLATQWTQASVEMKELAVTGRGELTRTSIQLTGETQALGADLRRLVARLDRVVGDLEDDPAMLLRGRGEERPGPGE